ncbi:MAG: SDR family oxidoreductase [Myxococcales bacterium]|nr:SDR family oxidoreductase [Myxococcales bacterium]MDH3486044.1 SDR family oxidoreductase [Myxococcales bacterium]
MTSRKGAFVTGGTGLIGHAVVERLLERGVPVVLMLRSGADERRAEALTKLNEVARVHDTSLSHVNGDLTEANLGLSDEGMAALSQAAHCFHIAALYDIEAPADLTELTNIEGTKNLLSALRKASFRGRLHHVSSIAVAGDYTGTFTESMFEEGQKLPDAYHRSKLESEKLVRESGLDHRVYRPSSVVGDSKTGEIDRIDGIYYGFGAIQKLAAALPSWVRVPVPRIRGRFNVVPVDYVADAMVHIALSPAEARVFHLIDPKPQRFVRMMATLVKVAGGPRLGPAIDFSRMRGVKQAGSMASMLPSVRELRTAVIKDLGLPANGLSSMNLRVRFDDSNTQAALRDTEIRCPHLKTYAKTLYRYYEDHLDPMTQRPLRYRKALAGKVMLVTGSSRGIGASAARIAAEAGAKVLLVARDEKALEEVAEGIRANGGEAHVYPTDLSDLHEVDALAESVLASHGGVDILVHNAARSIRRPATDALDRFHDYERTMALNYFSPVRLTLRLLPALRERAGTISHVLTMGVLVPGPYFGAYLASKSALDAFGDSLAAELHHEGIHVSSVYLPLVKTEMVAPTEEFAGRVDAMTPDQAAIMILDGIVDRKRRVMTPPGRFFALSNRLTPMATIRVLNLIRRTFPIGDTPSEFPAEKAFITKAIGGSPI